MRTELPSAEKFMTAHFPAGTELLCAVSGGLDSMCLLDFALRWAEGRNISVSAAHFHHGLRGASADRDEAFVRDYCEQRGIPFVSDRGDARALAEEDGLSLEEAARRLRYAFLEEAAAKRRRAAILTAHHADDNAETMLLNLCRGTGSAGLGIPAVRGNICRPFLELTRAQLADYAAARDLPHVEDETNDEDAAARNLLRHRVLPVLREINPKAAQNMARSAALLAEEDALLDELAAKLLEKTELSGDRAVLPWEVLRSAPEALRGRMVLRLMETVCGRRRDLSAAHAGAVLSLGKGRECSLPYGLLARNNGEALELYKASPRPRPVPLLRGQIVEFGKWRVLLGSEGPPGSVSYRLCVPGPLEVTLWRSGDRMNLPGSRGARTLKRLYADAGISPEERDRLPVLRTGERPVAAPYLGVDLEFSAGASGDWVTFYSEDIEGETI
ncbi:tRNA lysidine(34) synthetase TilS [uncultured Oscillibacter sp.]|uniref:tRNA lysidine(34) synthetase TilS n=1 Tax=uncultured Oscillibacter sp. TaxID=876091 RepID=UPI0025E80C71|nr:tRNA lysidine(34) synthetase TilS [uncultured Oscillibacter sp.]